MWGSLCVYNVPMALDSEGLRTDGLDPLLAYSRNRWHVQESRRCTLGPIPPIRFIDEFLSPLAGRAERKSMLSFQKAFAAIPKRANTPEQIYDPLVLALNEKTASHSRCPEMIFQKTIEDSIRPERLGHTKPHISCFAAENMHLVEQVGRESRDKLGYAEMIIQVAPDSTLDYFADPDPKADADSLAAHKFAREVDDDDEAYRQAERAFGLHVGFAIEIFARQQRTFLFTVAVYGSSARFFRWDRAGCVVSEAFDLHKRPEIFSEFLWRFAHLGDWSRGHDCTVSQATEAQERLFRDTIRQHVALQLELSGDELEKAMLVHYQPGHATILRVDPQQCNGPDPASQEYIVSRPTVTPLQLSGRCTRGYWAVSVDTGKVAFVKDTWRLHSKCDRDVEGDVLWRLNDLGVRNIPSIRLHGDCFLSPIGQRTAADRMCQETKTNRYRKEPWALPIDGKAVRVGKHRHYRLVTDTVGYSLRSAQGTEELLHATHDVLLAMKDALAKGSRIHRDISVGNIILVKEPGSRVRRGCLIDWDASDRVDEKGEALHPGRAGTWAFMSFRMLETTGEYEDSHTFKDDLEALLYVVFYCGIMYLPHDLTEERLTWLYEQFFERSDMFGSETYGGDAKRMNAQGRRYTRTITFGDPAFAEWLNTVMDYHSPLEDVQEKYKGFWDGDHLDEFWSRFLAAHELERGNRTVHQVSKYRLYDRNSLSTETSDSTPSAPSPASTPDPEVRPKRAITELGSDVEDGRSEAKMRRRSGAQSSETANSALSPPPPDAVAPSPLRRSKRIHERSAREVLKPRAATSADAVSSVSPAPRRRGSRGRSRK
ncbi:hypothetical protein FKP32DRAFT_1653023 [Trametes sanguinea]|nr:hypothetical protein FKP32DRAFT_1653023 [Trametes sanguinea]